MPTPTSPSSLTECSQLSLTAASEALRAGWWGTSPYSPTSNGTIPKSCCTRATDSVWKRSFATSNNAGPLSATASQRRILVLLLGRFRAEGRQRSVRAANPAQHAASVFDDLLEARGIVITQRPLAGVAPTPSERTMLGVVESPPLSEILTRMLELLRQHHCRDAPERDRPPNRGIGPRHCNSQRSKHSASQAGTPGGRTRNR